MSHIRAAISAFIAQKNKRAAGKARALAVQVSITYNAPPRPSQPRTPFPQRLFRHSAGSPHQAQTADALPYAEACRGRKGPLGCLRGLVRKCLLQAPEINYGSRCVRAVKGKRCGKPPLTALVCRHSPNSRQNPRHKMHCLGHQCGHVPCSNSCVSDN